MLPSSCVREKNAFVFSHGVPLIAVIEEVENVYKTGVAVKRNNIDCNVKMIRE